MVEAHHATTAARVHDGKAHGIGVADGLVGEPFEPGSGRAMVRLAGEDDGEQRAGLETVERRHCGTDAGPVEQETVRLGEDVAAYVTLRPGAAAEPDELIAHCRERLAAFKYPRRLTVLDALPKSPTGKILKGRLSES